MSESVYSLFRTFVLEKVMLFARAFFQTVFTAKVDCKFYNGLVVLEAHRLPAFRADEERLPTLGALSCVGEYDTK